MRKRFWKMNTAAAVLVLMLCLGLFPGAAGAANVLQNASFERYDATTLVPDHWQVTGGNVAVYADQAHEGAVSVQSLGGTNIAGVDTPNPPQSGTLVQLIDLSTLQGWDAANWLTVGIGMKYRLWGATKVYIHLEYLPSGYDATAITPDDAAWSGPDVKRAIYTYASNHASTSTPWYDKQRIGVEIPKVRWVRARFVFDAVFKASSRFTDGPYYIAADSVWADVEPIVPEAPCADNLLLNPGFESVSGNVPTDWQVRSGRMVTIDLPNHPPYAGDVYVGNIGGYATPNPDPAGNPIDHPDPPQHGSLVQLVDMSGLAGWNEASFLTFGLRGNHLRHQIQNISATVEYLPESYNNDAVAWNDPAWETEAQSAVRMELVNTNGRWKPFQTDQGSMPPVRWVRVRLDVDDSSAPPYFDGGEYLGGFDQVCLQAEAVEAGELIQNASFEDQVDSKPVGWHEDPTGGPAWTMMEPQPSPDGELWLGKPLVDDQPATTCLYQVIDLGGRIPGWTAIDPVSGVAVENKFVQFALNALVTNVGGTSVKLALEYLPHSYNAVDGITWDHAAWQARQWTSDGTDFTNKGGDAIDLGAVVEDTTVSMDPVWRTIAYDGWLPRVRWIRLRIEMDATVSSGPMGLVGIDAMSLTAACTQWGPYSGFGNLPEATFWENPDAPDKPIPAWVGPEGDGISGGYTGQTKRNHVNPAFAGFADAVADYSPSGQHIYNVSFEEPMAITGRPWNDSGWNCVIVTMGDMDIPMLSDYFGPAPTGNSHPGEITATFNETPIVNGPGHDFATFENGFSAGWTTAEIFAELAYVEVSSNGTDFIRMPNHSLTPKWPGSYGCIYASGVFGLTGKHINAYGDQWGTPFDLDWIADHPLVLNGTVDLGDIRYVRQVDIPGGGPKDANQDYTGLFHDSHGNPIYDSWVTWGSGGADLDAVAVMNTSAADSDGDHISDHWDNCSGTSNDNQYDTDGDGFGNRCDCDIDGETGGDGTVNTADFLAFRQAFGGHGPERIAGEPGQSDTYTDPSTNWNADADFNGDNVVNTADFVIFRSRYGDAAPFH